MSVRIGTSGWVYKHWKGIFYPDGLPQREWFSHYATTFDTVEINNSFYRLPSADSFKAWKDQAPKGFLYAVKASRFITHMKKLKDPEDPLELFFDRATQLGNKLGPVLYQLPPHWRVDLRRFEHFLAALPRRHKHVVEFREQSWLIEDVFRLMERYRVGHCIHDKSSLKMVLRVTADFVYVRFHGDTGVGGDYPRATLTEWADRIKHWRAKGLEVFVYFNNDAGGYAINNAIALRQMLQKSAATLRR